VEWARPPDHIHIGVAASGASTCKRHRGEWQRSHHGTKSGRLRRHIYVLDSHDQRSGTRRRGDANHTGSCGRNQLPIALAANDKRLEHQFGRPSILFTHCRRQSGHNGRNNTDGVTKLIALDQTTGAIAWGPIELSGPASIAYEGGKIFVLSCPTASSAGFIQSFDIASGTLDWSTPIAANGYAGVTALNGIIYISSGPTYAISEGSGTIIWTQPAGPNQGGSSTPAVTSDGVYVSYPCLTSDFQPSNGTEIFSTSTGCVGEGMPVVANGLLYSPQETPNSGAILNASTGSVVGSYVADGTPAFSGTTGYFLQSLNGSLNAVSSSNAVLWSFSGDGQLVTSPIVVNQTVFMGSTSGNVYALDAATGQQLWMANAGGAILVGYYPITGLAAGDGVLIVPAGNQVVAYRLSTGS